MKYLNSPKHTMMHLYIDIHSTYTYAPWNIFQHLPYKRPSHVGIHIPAPWFAYGLYWLVNRGSSIVSLESLRYWVV